MTFKITKLTIRKNEGRNGEPHKKRDKIYIFINNETILENLVNRRTRPFQVYKKEIIPLLMEELKTKHPDTYIHVKGIRWSWNQSCGCSMCPCSPGFVGDANKYFDFHTFFLDVEVLP
jgi:hypothetical protein